MTGNPQHQANRAFTLIEILVALGIVLILVAILLPVLAKAREAANSAACISNLRALSIDYTDYCTTTPHMNNGWLYDYGMWLTELAPIIGNPGSTNIGDNSQPTSYITPSIQKLAICPSTSLPPGFTYGATLTQPTPPNAEPYVPVTTGAGGNVNASIGNGTNNAFNPTIAISGGNTPNDYTTWAVGDSTINGYTPTAGGTTYNNWIFGSYGFNAWLYNGYGATGGPSNPSTYNIGGDINNIPWTYINTNVLGGISNIFFIAVFNANGNSQYSQANAYLLDWGDSGQAPTPETPVFFDSAWMEAEPTYVDPPALKTGAAPPSPYAFNQNKGNIITSVSNTTYAQNNGDAAIPISSGLQNLAPPHTNTGMYYVCINRHNMSVNVGFADGHAENVSLGNLWTLNWSATPPTPAGTAQSIQSP